MVQNHFRDDAQSAPVRLAQKRFEIAERAIHRMNLEIIGDVVAVIAQRRRIERQQPDRRHAEVLDVIQLLRQPAEIARAVAVRIVKGADVDFINDAGLIPERVVVEVFSVGIRSGMIVYETVVGAGFFSRDPSLNSRSIRRTAV